MKTSQAKVIYMADTHTTPIDEDMIKLDKKKPPNTHLSSDEETKNITNVLNVSLTQYVQNTIIIDQPQNYTSATKAITSPATNQILLKDRLVMTIEEPDSPLFKAMNNHKRQVLRIHECSMILLLEGYGILTKNPQQSVIGYEFIDRVDVTELFSSISSLSITFSNISKADPLILQSLNSQKAKEAQAMISALKNLRERNIDTSGIDITELKEQLLEMNSTLCM